MEKILKFPRLPAAEKALFLEAVFAMYMIRLLMVFVSMKKLSELFSAKNATSQPENETRVKNIGTAVARANQLAFWKNQCIVKSLAGRLMLNRRNIASELFLGVALSEDKKVRAHAWLKAANTDVVANELNYKVLFKMK